MGHIARLIEAGGIPTVVVASAVFEDKLTAMRLPRLVLTRQMMGRTLGRPGDVETQQKYLEAAFEMLNTAEVGGKIHFPD